MIPSHFFVSILYSFNFLSMMVVKTKENILFRKNPLFMNKGFLYMNRTRLRHIESHLLVITGQPTYLNERS